MVELNKHLNMITNLLVIPYTFCLSNLFLDISLTKIANFWLNFWFSALSF